MEGARTDSAAAARSRAPAPGVGRIGHGGHGRALGVGHAGRQRHRLHRHAETHELAQLALHEGLGDLRVAGEHREDRSLVAAGGCVV